MSIDSIATLLETLRQGRILTPPHLEQLAVLGARFGGPRALAKDLLERGWLTAYQINQMFQGNAARLVLGQYVLLERLGEGGMGQVFKARHQRLERTVALKVIRKDRLSHPDAIHRFQREARAAARLSHPNIVTIYDADEVGGTHFLAMEYVEGTDLSQLVRKRGPLSVALACDYIRQAALGLQHAHEQGMVHRDIKPANLFLTAMGVVKILDMGLARLQEIGEDPGQNTEAMTQEGAVMGTPDFIAPEQAVDSHTADIRADLYSLGCTLYYLMAGKVPFSGGTLGQKIAKHLARDPRRIEELRPDVPPAVAVIVRKLMAKQPERRYQKPAELAAALAAFAGRAGPSASSGASETVAYTAGVEAEKNTFGISMTVAPQPPTGTYPQATVYRPPPSRLKKHWRRAAAAGGLLLAVVLGLIVFGFGKGKDKPGGDAGWPLDNLEPAEISGVREFDWPPKGLVLVLGGHRGRHWGPVRSVAYSPNGKLVASAGDDHLICVWDAETLKERVLLRGHTDAVLCLTFTPDSKRLLSGSADKTVRLWDIKGRKKLLKLEGHTNPVTCVAVSVDGTRALSGAGGPFDHTVRLWDLTGKGREVVACKGHSGGVHAVAFAATTGTLLSCSRDRTLRRWNPQKGIEIGRTTFDQVAHGALCQLGMAFSQNGGHLVLGRDNAVVIWDVEKDKAFTYASLAGDHRVVTVGDKMRWYAVWGSELKVIGLQPPTERRFSGHQGAVTSMAFSPDAKRLISGGVDGTVRLWDIESGKEVMPRPGHTTAVQSVALSKDGRYVLTGGADQTVRLWDLASSMPGREVRPFPGHVGAVVSVHFLPNGRVLSGSADGTARIWDLENGKPIRQLEHGGHVALSTDGLRALSGGGALLWDVESGSELKRLDGQYLDCGGAFCPGGPQMLSGSHGEGGGVLRLWEANNGKAQAYLVGTPRSAVTAAAGSPDGHFALAGSADGTVRLWDLKKGAEQKPTVLVGLTSSVTSVAYAPDGKTVAASAVDGKVIVWDVATGKPRQEWKMPGAVHAIAFDEQGRHLATANGNGTVYILRLDMATGGK
jgi:WD40 repeat protein/serine/threonine protein kinase